MRVAMDFSWPLNSTWHGYLNPHEAKQCPDCESGYSPRAQRLSDEWYGKHDGHFYNREVAWGHHLTQEDVQALVDGDRLWDFTRRPLNEEQKKNCWENGWTKEPNGYVPTAEEINTWSEKGMGHDSINAWVCIKARCEKEGVSSTCSTCGGSAQTFESELHRERHEKWEPQDPIKGEGFQLWETTSDGSPQSPVFATLEELAAWCENNASTFGSMKASKESWMKMLDEDHVYHKEGNNIFI